MELSKYNKLEKLGFTFWTKKQEDEIELELFLIGVSKLIISSPRSLGLNKLERERFIKSVAYFLKEDSIERIDLEKATKQDIKTAYLFDSLLIESLYHDHIKILSFPSLESICSSANAKQEFFIALKGDLTL